MRFTTTIESSGKTATGFRVPSEVVAALGKGKKPPVTVTINGHTYRSTIAAYGDISMLPLSAENRAAAGVAAGDTVEVDVELDSAPRVVEVPEDFAAAIAADPAAAAFWPTISYSNQRWHVLSIDGARTPETRQRRIEKSVSLLRERRVQG